MEDTQVKVIDKLIMLGTIVKDMPKAKEFYADKLGLKVVTDYRQDDDHWWVSLALPDGGVTITLTTYHENVKQGIISLYFATSDVHAANKELRAKDLKVNDVKDDLYGPGSGVKWFNLEDPDGNWVHFVQS
jgi:catechol 2,3-dioxygenase-like lactoylglutathione lyase family enzyme